MTKGIFDLFDLLDDQPTLDKTKKSKVEDKSTTNVSGETESESKTNTSKKEVIVEDKPRVVEEVTEVPNERSDDSSGESGVDDVETPENEQDYQLLDYLNALVDENQQKPEELTGGKISSSLQVMLEEIAEPAPSSEVKETSNSDEQKGKAPEQTVEDKGDVEKEEAKAIAEAKKKREAASKSKTTSAKPSTTTSAKKKSSSSTKKDPFTVNEQTVIRYAGETFPISVYFTEDEIKKGLQNTDSKGKVSYIKITAENLRQRMENAIDMDHSFPELVENLTVMEYKKDKNMVIPVLQARKKGGWVV